MEMNIALKIKHVLTSPTLIMLTKLIMMIAMIVVVLMMLAPKFLTVRNEIGK